MNELQCYQSNKAPLWCGVCGMFALLFFSSLLRIWGGAAGVKIARDSGIKLRKGGESGANYSSCVLLWLVHVMPLMIHAGEWQEGRRIISSSMY